MKRGFATVFFLILFILAGLVYFFWDEITVALQNTFTVGEERNSEIEEVVEDLEEY